MLWMLKFCSKCSNVFQMAEIFISFYKEYIYFLSLRMNKLFAF